MRAEIEEAVQFALDTADRLIALLDGMDGEPEPTSRSYPPVEPQVHEVRSDHYSAGTGDEVDGSRLPTVNPKLRNL